MGDSNALVVLNLWAFLLCAVFLTYVALIVTSYVRRRTDRTGDPGQYRWHLVMPCLDEEAVIEHSVITALNTFREARLWCIDDGSADATPEILARLQLLEPRLHVITRTAPNAQ